MRELRTSGEMSRRLSAGHQGVALAEWSGLRVKKQDQIRTTNEWKEWRKAVYARDHFVCRLCGKNRHNLQPHHIRAKSKHPEMIFDVGNGITLCRPCHGKTFGHEEAYEVQFYALIRARAFKGPDGAFGEDRPTGHPMTREAVGAS